VLLAIGFSIGLIWTDHRYGQLDGLRTVLSAVVAPLHYLADLPSTLSRTLEKRFSDKAVLRQENARLHRENLILQARLQKLEALEMENIRLRDLLDSSFKIGNRVLIAELLSVDLDPYRQVILIDKGSDSGVFLGQPVLDAHAVMGQVIRVNPFSASVLLITDATHSLPVQINRNGLYTIAMGTGMIDQLKLPYLQHIADVKVGDLLVTSGLGGRFPAGYPVARISRVERTAGQPFATVIAEPTARLDRAREVLLVWNLSPLAQTREKEEK